MKLYEQFSQRGYHSCVMTTFGIDFGAYENIVLPRLRTAGCNNNLVVADARMLVHTLDTTTELPRQAGRQYTIAGAHSKGVFHPKVVLQLGRKAGRLFVSSANLTAPGLAGNLEVIGHIAASPESVGESRLLAAAWHYLARFLDMDQEVVAHQVAWMRQRAAWLMDSEPSDATVSLTGGDEAAFITANGNRSIASRFVELLGGDAVKRLIVVSPYWDEDLAALRDLHEATGAREVCVLVGGRKPSFPSSSLVERDAIRLYALEAGESKRFVHGKLIIAQTRDADHVLYGSANCTVAAMGSMRNFAGRNDEACIYRRMRRDAVLRELGLENALAKDKLLKKLPEWQVQPEVPLDAAIGKFPGRFEVRGGYLLWWPSAAYSHPSASIELVGHDGALLPVELLHIDTRAEGFRRFVMSNTEVAPSFARVRIGDAVSVSTVVMLADVLRNEIREGRTRQLEEVADRLNSKERLGLWIMDFIDLIAQAEAVESEGGVPEAKRASGGNSGKKPPAPVVPRTLSYEEFVAGRRLRSERNAITRHEFAGSDLHLVRSYLNRLIGHGSIVLNGKESEDDASIRAALELRDEIDPGDEGIDVDNLQSTSGDSDLQGQRKRKGEQEEEVRKALALRLSARDDIAWYSAEFCKEVLEKASTKRLTMHDVLRLRAILMVMFGSSCPIGAGILNGEASETQVLRSDGNASWPRLIGKVISTFFGGQEPAISGLMMSTVHDEPPVEMIECLATCFWAVQVCRVAAGSKREMQGLKKHLDELATQLYRRSGLSRDDFDSGPVMAIFERLSVAFALGASSEQLLSMHGESFARLGAADGVHAEAGR